MHVEPHKDDRFPLDITATVIGMGQQQSQKIGVGCAIIVLTPFGMVLPCGSCVPLLFLSLARVAKLGFVSWSQAFQWPGLLDLPCPPWYVVVPSEILKEFIYSSFWGVFCVWSVL